MAASTYNPLQARPNPTATASPSRPWRDSSAASPLASAGYRIAILYLILLAGRVPEITAFLIGSSFYQILALTVVLMALAAITGVLVRVASSRIGLVWMAFHLWVLFTLPFSGYRKGSVDSLIVVGICLPATFILGGFLIQNTDRLRRGVFAMAWAGVIGLAWVLYTGVAADEDRLVSLGTFNNSNLLAIYLLIMTPFWSFIVMNGRYRWITRLFFAGVIIEAMLTVLSTGSRSGMMSIGVLGLGLFFSVSLVDKFKLAVIGLIAVLGVLAWMPATLKSRLGTVFHSQAKDEIAAEALGSSEARYALLVESIETTIKHPIFGVGLGVYSSVAAREKEITGDKALWQVTHNMYTQISSETGIPGFILYMTALGFSIRAVWRVRRAGKDRPELRELGMIGSTILAAFLVLCFNGCFTSMALEFTMYMLVGFSIATSFVFKDAMRQSAEERQLPAAIAPAHPSRQFFPGAPVAGPAAIKPAEKKPDAPWRLNPRKYPPLPGSPGR